MDLVLFSEIVGEYVKIAEVVPGEVLSFSKYILSVIIARLERLLELRIFLHSQSSNLEFNSFLLRGYTKLVWLIF